jgi:ABC-2 type transport system permease protein
MSKIGQVIEREYMSRVRKKSFIILTFLTPFLLLAMVAVPLLLSFIKDSDAKQVSIIDNTGLYAKRIEGNKQYNFVVVNDNPETYKQKAIDDKNIYAYMVIDGNLVSDTGSVTLYSRKQVEMDLKDLVRQQLKDLVKQDKIESYNIPGLKKIIEDANPDVNINTIKMEEDGSEKESSSEIAMAIGFICTFIIYIFIFVYGAMVMNGVIEEKTNRIVEIIVSSVKPFELMMGKIIGIALVGLTQVLMWVLIIAVFLGIATYTLKDQMTPDNMTGLTENVIGNQAISINGQTIDANAISSANDDGGNQVAEIITKITNLNLVELVVWFILFFLGGYLLYSSLFAAVGSAIDNQEDAQQFTLPLTIPVLFALYAGMYSASNPDGPLAFWCSLIPFTSPIVMMVRIPFGVPFWQLALSYGLLVITFILTTKLASKIYRTGILMYGKKVTYKELFKWLKYKN